MKLSTTLSSVIVSFFVLTSSTPAVGQEKHRIDKWLEQEIARDSTTAGMSNAVGVAESMWDRDLNITYNKLMSSLPKEQAIALQQSQHNWLKFRDTEFDVISQLVERRPGTVWANVAANNRLQIVRARVLQLHAYLP